MHIYKRSLELVYEMIWEITEINIQENPDFKLLGAKNENIFIREQTVCNFVIFITKWEIWKHRNIS